MVPSMSLTYRKNKKDGGGGGDKAAADRAMRVLVSKERDRSPSALMGNGENNITSYSSRQPHKHIII
jgi:hypothetical protein